MEALKAWDRPYTVNEGDGAFYGQKLMSGCVMHWAVGINVPLYNLILIYLIDLTSHTKTPQVMAPCYSSPRGVGLTGARGGNFV